MEQRADEVHDLRELQRARQRRLPLLAFRGAPSPAAADAFLADLADREFAIPRCLVADMACVSAQRGGAAVTMVLEALTIAVDPAS